MLTKKIPPKPTRYRGIQFRSRLEARYAAFFDLNGVRWAYEPLDLNGYTPDFVISEFSATTGRTYNTLVEVKPGMDVQGLRRCTKKIDEAAPKCTVVVAGIAPWICIVQLLTEPFDYGPWLHVPSALDMPPKYYEKRTDESLVRSVYARPPSAWWIHSGRYETQLLDDPDRLALQQFERLQMDWAHCGEAVMWRRPGRADL